MDRMLRPVTLALSLVLFSSLLNCCVGSSFQMPIDILPPSYDVCLWPPTRKALTFRPRDILAALGPLYSECTVCVKSCSSSQSDDDHDRKDRLCKQTTYDTFSVISTRGTLDPAGRIYSVNVTLNCTLGEIRQTFRVYVAHDLRRPIFDFILGKCTRGDEYVEPAPASQLYPDPLPSQTPSGCTPLCNQSSPPACVAGVINDYAIETASSLAVYGAEVGTDAGGQATVIVTFYYTPQSYATLNDATKVAIIKNAIASAYCVDPDSVDFSTHSLLKRQAASPDLLTATITITPELPQATNSSAAFWPTNSSDSLTKNGNEKKK